MDKRSDRPDRPRSDDPNVAGLLEILAATPDFVTSRLADGELIYLNRAARRWLGLPAGGADGPGSLDDIPAELRDFEQALARMFPPWALEVLRNEGFPAAREHGVWQGETALLDADGREVPVSQVLLTHRDADGDVRQISTIMRDISTAKGLERRLREERDFSERVLDSLPDVFVLLDRGGCVVRWNREFERLLARPGESLAGRSYVELCAAGRGDEVAAWIDAVREQGSASLEVEVRDAAGASRCLAMQGVCIEVEAGTFLSLIGSDITERREAEARERWRNRILTRLARDEPLPAILDLITRSVEAEAPDSLCSILLLDDEGERLYHGAAPNLPRFFLEAIEGIVIGEDVGSCGTAAWRDDLVVVEDIRTDPLWAEFREITLQAGLLSSWSRPIRSAPGRVLGTFAIYHREPRAPDAEDIERISRAADLASLAIERKRMSDALAYQASHDELTRLENRRRIEERLQDEIRRAERYARPFSVAILDVDHFKAVNDRHGHGVGDRVLRDLAEVLSSNVRLTDTCGRWGGEEFLLILQETALDGALSVTEELRRSLGENEFPPVGRMTVSMGVCEYNPGEGKNAALRRVDAALYAAKAAGRNRVVAG